MMKWNILWLLMLTVAVQQAKAQVKDEKGAAHAVAPEDRPVDMDDPTFVPMVRVGKVINRPLLQVQDALAKFRDLYRARDAIYRETAHIVIEVGADDCQATFEQILKYASEYEKGLA